MTLKDVINSWNKTNKFKDDDFMFEQLGSYNPDNCYFIDRFPMVVESNEKYSQLEIFYDAVLDGNLSAEMYHKEEEKMKNIIKKLWAYSLVKVETYLTYEEETGKIESIIKKNKIPLVNELKKIAGEDLFIVDDINYLDILLELGLRDRVHSVFIFSDMKIIAWTNGFEILLYMGDLKNKEMIEKIVCTEGMYLRPYNKLK